MKVLLNATTLNRGGALQVAVEFCQQLAADTNKVGWDWELALSQHVAEAIKNRGIEVPLPAHIFEDSPAKSRRERKRLLAIENTVQPDCVFTLFGPAYVSFKSPHLCGVADGWVTHADFNAYRCLGSPLSWLSRFAAASYKGLWFRSADAWVVEAECARQGLARRFLIPKSRIFLVENTCASHFRECQNNGHTERGTSVRILTFCCGYQHKYLEILPEVAREIKSRRPNLDFEFQFTLDDMIPLTAQLFKDAERLGVRKNLRNLGTISLSDGPTVYRQANICFLPTVLETFSATYPEAMAMKVPIVTTDLPFARNVCGDAALYFRARDAGSATTQAIAA